MLPVGTRDEVVAAWRLHSRLVRRSLERGFYQGWDLHPAQLVTRYAATYAFYREGLPRRGRPPAAYAGQRAASGQEEPATVRALAGFLHRGPWTAAPSPNESWPQTGLDRRAAESRSPRGAIPDRGR